MSWKHDISAPSFRGVPFEVESDDMQGGRRTATHEYPLRDTPYTEDLGRKARTFSIDGFVVGRDYMARRDRLAEALEAPGPGLLVHPQYGRIEVVAQTFRITHATGKGGMAVFQMTFVVSGKAVNPGVSTRTQDILFSRAGAASDSAMDLLDRVFSVAGVPSFVTEAARAVFVEAAGLVGSGRTSVPDVAAFARRAAALTSMTASDMGGLRAGTALGSLFVDEGLAAVEDMAAPGVRMREMLDMIPSIPPRILPVPDTPSRRRMAGNVNGVAGFLRQMATSEAARAAAGVVPETTRDAVRMSREITAAIDDVLETTDDDTVFGAFTSLRAAAVRDLSVRARQAKQLREYVPAQTGPALVMAHRACQAGAREADALVVRNGVRHPGFVGVLPLTVVVDA